eukprot:TRINITY_DN25784_c0_g1_i1.p1 TRINITY_DN25784_c0_g1~~TRINITY_DN25784_c0_g1_i1.p1  ORF type:complete len:975 (-),score=203.61 TRINITY_DN25784_c0_g1_i1:145-3069(-)
METFLEAPHALSAHTLRGSSIQHAAEARAAAPAAACTTPGPLAVTSSSSSGGGLREAGCSIAIGCTALALFAVSFARGYRRRRDAAASTASAPRGAKLVACCRAEAGTATASGASRGEVDAANAYNHAEIEARWQAYWEQHKTFCTPDRKPGSDRPKKYVLDMFPYPSGAGLHVGHPLGYTATDVYSRFFRAKGYDVLHPMGFDAFGLPAEQYAIQTGTHPASTTRKNIDNFRGQLKRLGFSYDWDREFATIDDGYVRWTQWIFLQIFKKGLGFQEEKPVNWCEKLGTVLANEEVIDGKSERGGHPVTRQPVRQWVLNIGHYAEELLAGLDDLDWPAGTKDMQRAWIGRSEGATVLFQVEAGDGSAAGTADVGDLEVFTTRPDTLYGVTHVVLAPEHPLAEKICSASLLADAKAYIEKTALKSDRDREAGASAASGVPLGAHAIHPLTGEKVPIWIADYVLGGYGTGAVMAVPAHDTRDFTFAQAHGLPTDKVVVKPAEGSEVVSDGSGSASAFTGLGVSCASADAELDGLSSAKMKKRIIAKLEDKAVGGSKIQYRLSDWLFSRQRYWGEPIPIYFPCKAADEAAADFDPRRGDDVIVDYSSPIAVEESELPLLLPPMEDFSPTGDPQGRLAAALEWRFFQKDGKWYCRESNTMPQWAGSCWYYLRYCQPPAEESTRPVSDEAEKAWMPVDLYIGGKEHAVLHLLYARFWHKVLHDIGVVHTAEPFSKLVHQGLILGSDGTKMSKSVGNVINPDDVVQSVGADALRLYEMGMGPLENEKPWQTEQISGMVRFRDRVHKVCQLAEASVELDKETQTLMHKTIKAVTEQTERLTFNTAITTMIVFSKHLEKMKQVPMEAADALVRLVQPYAPHLAEECWQGLLQREGSVALAPWPEFREELCVDDSVSIPVQVNGKSLKVVINLPKAEAADKKTGAGAAEAAARELEAVQKALNGKDVKKCIYVPGKILNFVVKK